jgi:hypothetical protein
MAVNFPIDSLKSDCLKYVPCERVINASYGDPHEAVISSAISCAHSIPRGFNGAEGKVKRHQGSFCITETAEGIDIGFTFEFGKTDLKDAAQIFLFLKGKIVLLGNDAHYISIRPVDSDKYRDAGWQYCLDGRGNCKGQSGLDIGIIKNKGMAISMEIQPAKEWKNITGFTITFLGNTRLERGLAFSNMKLLNTIGVSKINAGF